MKTNAGVWIDHRKAVIVRLRDSGEEILEIPSHMEKHVRFSGGAAETWGEDQRDMRFAGHLHTYYEKVVSPLRDADAILILGPGEAKGEFKTCFDKEALGDRVAGIVTVDKMTDRQIAAKVREHFRQSAEDLHLDQKH